VLFLDEPTRSLDPSGAADVQRLIREYLVSELGRAVVLATHSLPEAEALCDRIALMKSGRIVGQGTVAELRKTLTTGVRCELRLRRVPPELPARLHRLRGVLSVDVAHDEPLAC